MKIFLQDYLPDQQQFFFSVESTPEEQAEDKEYSVMADLSQRILFHCRPMQLSLQEKRSHYSILNCQTEMIALLLMNVRELCKKHKVEIVNLQEFVSQEHVPTILIDQWPRDLQFYLANFLDKKDKGSLMATNIAMRLDRPTPEVSLRQQFPHVYQSMQNQEVKQSDNTSDEIDKAYWLAQKKANVDEYKNMNAREKFLMKLCKTGDPVGFHRQFGIQECGALIRAHDINDIYALQWAYQNQHYYFLNSIYLHVIKNDEYDQLSCQAMQTTPLDWAIACRQPLETLERILHNNLDFYREYYTKHSQSPVYTAITHRNIEAIDLFHSAGFDLCQAYYSSATPLHVAFWLKNNLEMTRHIITKRYINPTHQMFVDLFSGNAPIESLALCCDHMPVDETGVALRVVIDELHRLEEWSDSKKAYDALKLLCEHPKVKNVTKVLSETTAEIKEEKKSTQVNKLLFNVLRKGKMHIAAYLVEQAPELVSLHLFVSLFEVRAALAALEFCCAHMSPRYCEWSLRVVIDLFLAKGDARTEYKLSVIKLLCSSPKVKDASNVLCESTDKEGKTVLYYALSQGYEDVAKFLIEKAPELKSGNDLYHLVFAAASFEKLTSYCEEMGLSVHNEKRALQKPYEQSALYYLLYQHFLTTLNMQFPDRDTSGWREVPQKLHYMCARSEVVFTYLQGGSLFAPNSTFEHVSNKSIRTTPQAFLEAFLRHAVSTWFEKSECGSDDVLFPLGRALVYLRQGEKQNSFFSRSKIDFGIILLANMMIENVKHQMPTLLNVIEEGMRVIEGRKSERDFQVVYNTLQEVRGRVLLQRESKSSVSLKGAL